jgi:hypothetical protein
MSRRKGAIASSLRRTVSAIGADLEAEARRGRSKRRAASITGDSEGNKVPDTLHCKRDAAKLQAAFARAIGSTSSVVAHQIETQPSGSPPPESAGGMPASGAPAAKAAASPATSSPSTTSANTFARMSDSSGGAGSDSSSARRSSHSDGANTASNNSKGSASSMSTDSAYGQASPESLRNKFRGRASKPTGKAAAGGSSGRLTSIPEPAPAKQQGRTFGGLFAGFKTALRWT